MKTHLNTMFRILACLIIYSSVAAQNVGIGTEAPFRKLEVVDSSDAYIRITSPTNSGAGLELANEAQDTVADWRIFNNAGGNLTFSKSSPVFPTLFTGNTVFTNDGRYGFGTTSLTADFMFRRSGPLAHMKLNSTNLSSNARFDLITGIESFLSKFWRMENESGDFVMIAGNRGQFSADSLEVFRIDDDGHMAIGRANSHTSLTVDGGPAVGETGEGDMQVGSPDGFHLRFDNNEILARNGDNPSTLFFQWHSGNLSLADDDDGKVGIGNSSPASKLHITDGVDASYAGHGSMVLGEIDGLNTVLDNNEILARNDGGESPLYIQNDGGDVLIAGQEQGQVGIGITSTATLPHTDYLLAVDGKIICEEARVEMSQDWPDYVFEDGYTLMPLDELEEEINALGHLPGIPSADVVEKDGLELGDMQRRMMEKIEELTLYIIDLKKEIDDLKKK